MSGSADCHVLRAGPGELVGNKWGHAPTRGERSRQPLERRSTQGRILPCQQQVTRRDAGKAGGFRLPPFHPIRPCQRRFLCAREELNLPQGTRRHAFG